MAPNLKLTYFNIRGLAEQNRLLMIDNEIKFTDHKIDRADWPALKPNMLFGQIPVLYIDDKPLFQSGAIIRYLARLAGNLYGDSNDESSLIDMVYEAVQDMRKKYTMVVYGDDFDANKGDLISKTLPVELAIFEKILLTKDDGKAYINGAKISLADYALFDVLDDFVVLSATILDAFPNLKAFHSRIDAHPKLQNYLRGEERKNMKLNGNGKQ